MLYKHTYYMVRCDDCGKEATAPKETMSEAARFLRGRGWTCTVEAARTFCPQCRKKRIEG